MILRGENMIKTTSMLLEELSSYANPKAKLSRMVDTGDCVRISKGLYETDKNVSAYLLAGSIYGPSYISFEYALSYYGLIPEAVYTVTNATFDKKKKKIYETEFGTFTYCDIPSAAFPFGINLIKEGDYFYRIAEPEKALCDKLYSMHPVPNIRELEILLTDDLRIDKNELIKLNIEKVEFLTEKYKAGNVRKLGKLIRSLQNE